MKEIQLTQGKVALVDDEDYERVNQFKWYAQKHGNGTFRAVRNETLRSRKDARETGLPIHKTILMHRFILNVPDSMDIDHVNHNTLDNQKDNLRICTHSQNTMNQLLQGGTSSKYKGVCWNKQRKKWIVYIKCEGKRTNLGYFTDELEATKAYNAKAGDLHGEFAYLNPVK